MNLYEFVIFFWNSFGTLVLIGTLVGGPAFCTLYLEDLSCSVALYLDWTNGYISGINSYIYCLVLHCPVEAVTLLSSVNFRLYFLFPNMSEAVASNVLK